MWELPAVISTIEGILEKVKTKPKKTCSSIVTWNCFFMKTSLLFVSTEIVAGVDASKT